MHNLGYVITSTMNHFMHVRQLDIECKCSKFMSIQDDFQCAGVMGFGVRVVLTLF